MAKRRSPNRAKTKANLSPPKTARDSRPGPVSKPAARVASIHRKQTGNASAETPADLKHRSAKIVKALARTYHDAQCALEHATPFQLLVATILSAQCTDERVNAATPKLFGKYPDAASLAAAKPSDVEEIVHSLGFFRAKAANIIGMAEGLCTRFEGRIPQTVEELTSLPGVGRKTANVVLGTAFGIATGVVVDTHVRRISGLLGLTSNTDPEKIERDLMSILPQSEWVMYSHRVIHHGRRMCIARRPNCGECPLLLLCPRVGLPPLSVS